MEINSRPSLNRDAVRLLKIAQQHCYSENLSGLIIEITTVFLHLKSSPQPLPQIALPPAAPEFEALPDELCLDGLANIEFETFGEP